MRTAGKAFVISIVLDIVMAAFAGVVYISAPFSAAAKVLDRIGSPVEMLAYWLAPGHTLVQPLVDMLFSVLFDWLIVWGSLGLWTLLKEER